MLLLLMTVSCVVFGSSAAFERKEVCYGRDFSLPFQYVTPIFHGKVYLTPSDGRPRMLLIDDGKLQVEDPRIEVGLTSVRFTDLRGKDDGMISVSYDDRRRFDVIRLVILACAQTVTHMPRETFTLDVPRDAEFLEFSSSGLSDNPQVLWNRNNPQTNKGNRGKLRRNVWEISRVTQSDNGYYTFRKKGNIVGSRIQLSVKEDVRYYHSRPDELIIIEKPYDGQWTVSFTAEDRSDEYTLVEDVNLVRDDGWSSLPLRDRYRLIDRGIQIYPVESRDAGEYLFKDPEGNVALIAHLEVERNDAPTYTYVGAIAGVLSGMIVCCCCVRKCCCKKSSSKRDVSAPAPAVYNHDQNQPAGPSYSAAPAPDYSSLQMNPPVSREPVPTSAGPPVYSPVNIDVNPPQPEMSRAHSMRKYRKQERTKLAVVPLRAKLHQLSLEHRAKRGQHSGKVAAPGGQGAAPAFSLNSDHLSSDAEPKFELKGMSFPSAPPLSSDVSFCDVYTSDKLNFL